MLFSYQDMASVLEAYWSTSSKRFQDIIPQLVSSELLTPLETELLDVLHVHVQDIIEDAFRVPEAEIQEREQLNRKLESLTASDKLIRDAICL